MYARDNGGGDVALVAARMNWTGGERTWRVPIPADLGIDGVTLVDALHGTRRVTVTGGAVDLALNPWEYVVLSPQ
jgi:hypothetical protein